MAPRQHVDIDGQSHFVAQRDDSLTACGEPIPADAWRHLGAAPRACEQCLSALGLELNKSSLSGVDTRYAKIVSDRATKMRGRKVRR